MFAVIVEPPNGVPTLNGELATVVAGLLRLAPNMFDVLGWPKIPAV